MENKISFKNDYSEGAHPRILEVLSETNLQQEPGYGYDSISEKAKTYIKSHLANQDTPIYFVSGGTQPLIKTLRIGNCYRYGSYPRT